MDKIKVLVVDDQQLFRALLVEMLLQEDAFEVVATAGNGEEANRMIFQYNPDIVLLDINMPIQDGIETLEFIKSKKYKGKVVMLTTFEDEDKILKACKLGADGYLVKDIKPQALRKAIECVFDDLVVFHQDVYKQMATMMAQKIQAPQTYINGYLLNAVDIAIIKGISEGKTNKEIGESINYSEGTIKNRVSKLLAVTGLSDRTEVAIYALKNQII